MFYIRDIVIFPSEIWLKVNKYNISRDLFIF